MLAKHELVENVAPIQLAIRLLIPAGSRLLELSEVREMVEPFDEAALVYAWRHLDPRVDRLCEEVQELVRSREKLNRPRSRIFSRIWEVAQRAADLSEGSALPQPVLPVRAAIPYLNEPWYC